MYESKFGTNQPHLTVKPRRVRGGVRLTSKELPLTLSGGWVAESWLNAIAGKSTEEALAEGFAYARGGQTRSIEVTPGRIIASVQGRALRAYRLTIDAPIFTEAQWEGVIGAMSDQAIYGAKMLAGEMPQALAELFAARDMPLTFRSDELRLSCAAETEPVWCKHAVCVGLLVAELLDRRPFEVFALRGMAPGELLERLRERRSDSAPGGAAPVAGVSGMTVIDRPTSPPLEACVDDFWDENPALNAIETPLRKPEVSHALLRRLGPSPFTEGRFPLVGLLATCYDTISRSALSGSADTDCDLVSDGDSAGDEDSGPEPEVTRGASGPSSPPAAPETPAAGSGWPLGTAKRKTR